MQPFSQLELELKREELLYIDSVIYTPTIIYYVAFQHRILYVTQHPLFYIANSYWWVLQGRNTMSMDIYARLVR